jgi:hypothetical protein
MEPGMFWVKTQVVNFALHFWVKIQRLIRKYLLIINPADEKKMESGRRRGGMNAASLHPPSHEHNCCPGHLRNICRIIFLLASTFP